MESLFRKMRKKIHNFIISVKKYKKKIKTIVCNIGSWEVLSNAMQSDFETGSQVQAKLLSKTIAS